MTTNPETPETDNTEEEVVEPAPKKKPVRKRKPAAKKPTTRKASPKKVPTTPKEFTEEIKENLTETKDRVVEEAVQPAKELIDKWGGMADYAVDAVLNAKDNALAWWDGFVGNEKKKEEDE